MAGDDTENDCITSSTELGEHVDASATKGFDEPQEDVKANDTKQGRGERVAPTNASESKRTLFDDLLQNAEDDIDGPLQMEDYLAQEKDVLIRRRTEVAYSRKRESKVLRDTPAPSEIDDDDAQAWRSKIQLLVVACFGCFGLVLLAELCLNHNHPSFAFALHTTSAVALFVSVPAVQMSGAGTISGWKAFMPFEGGARFVSMQAVAWILYALALLLSIHIFVSFYRGLVDSVFGMFTLYGALALMSQVLVTSSFFQYENETETDNTQESNTMTDALDDDQLEDKVSQKVKSEPLPNGRPAKVPNFDSDYKLESCMQARRRASGALQVGSSFGFMQLLQTFIPEHHFEKKTSPARRRVSSVLVQSIPQFLGMNLFLALVGCLLAVLAAYVIHDQPIFSASAAVSSTCFFTLSVFNTYGTGGHTMHRAGQQSSKWSFYQPFKGGDHFVEMQIASWVLFCSSVVLQLGALVATYALGMQIFIGIMAVAGLFSFIAEMSMVFSLKVYGKDEVGNVSALRAWTVSVSTELHQMLMVTVLANLMYVPFVACSIPFFVLVPTEEFLYCWLAVVMSIGFFIVSFIVVLNRRNQYARTHKGEVPDYTWHQLLLLAAATDLPVLVCTHIVDSLWSKVTLHISLLSLHVYLASTFSGDPGVTGLRRSSLLREQMRGSFDSIQAYFNGKIIRKSELQPNKPHMFGFHPHGVTATSVSWVSHTSDWKELFPGITVNPATASVLHVLPLLRDFLQVMGFRDVTRTSLCNALDMDESILLVPGGQAEMVYSTSRRKELTIYTKHKGFIRLAVTKGVPLVPVLSLGETLVLSNIEARETATFFIKVFGVPVPFFPYGRWYLPIPRRGPITLIVGKPIEVELNEHPDPEYIDEICDKYYAQIRALFHEHKHETGHGDYEIIFV